MKFTYSKDRIKKIIINDFLSKHPTINRSEIKLIDFELETEIDDEDSYWYFDSVSIYTRKE